MSQQELADRLLARHGLNWYQSTVTKMESGSRPTRLTEALAVADALGLELAELLDRPSYGHNDAEARQRIEHRARLFQIAEIKREQVRELEKSERKVQEALEMRQGSASRRQATTCRTLKSGAVTLAVHTAAVQGSLRCVGLHITAADQDAFITTESLREIAVGDLVRDAAEQLGIGAEVTLPEANFTESGMTPAALRATATVYRWAVQTGQPPYGVLSRRYGLPRAKAARWLKRARCDYPDLFDASSEPSSAADYGTWHRQRRSELKQGLRNANVTGATDGSF